VVATEKTKDKRMGMKHEGVRRLKITLGKEKKKKKGGKTRK